VVEFADRVWEQVDSETQRLDVAGAFDDADLESLLRQRQRCGQAADAGSRDENLWGTHDSTVREVTL